ncbi:MAG: hypothetical protein ABIG39_02010 [Candidatus Micrarchaeota archaeon]
MGKLSKGQAAMEYLMTYGWAILIIVIVFLALMTFQIFTIRNPEFCQMPPGVLCTKTHLRASTDNLEVTLYNSFPNDMVVVAIGCSKRTNSTKVCTTELCGTAYPPGAKIARSGLVTFNLTCDDAVGDLDFDEGEEYSGSINLRYYFGDENDSMRIMSGRVFAVAN